MLTSNSDALSQKTATFSLALTYALKAPWYSVSQGNAELSAPLALPFQQPTAKKGADLPIKV